MAYQIQCTQTFQSPGKRWKKTERMYVDGWPVTLATEDEARAILNIMSRDPEQPYILEPHEFDAPHLSVVEGGFKSDEKPLADVIRIIGQSDYYNPDGSRKTDEEIYGEEDAAFIRRR